MLNIDISLTKFMFKTFLFSSLGTPGSAWTKEEVDIVREKIKEMVNIGNWRGIKHASEDPDEPDTYNGTPRFVQDGTLSDDNDNNLSNTEHKFCCGWQLTDINRGQVPTTSKVIRLAFHDCVPYVDEDGTLHGGNKYISTFH